MQGSIITKENEEGKNVYFIKDGECTVEKLLCFEEGKEKRYQNTNICIVQSGATVGEECLLKGHLYQYTVVAKSNKVLCFQMRKTVHIPELHNLQIYSYLQKKYRFKK